MTIFPILGQYEVWQFINLTGDTHPMHIHLNPFQVLARHPVTVTVPEGGITDNGTVATPPGVEQTTHSRTPSTTTNSVSTTPTLRGLLHTPRRGRPAAPARAGGRAAALGAVSASRTRVR